MSPSWFAHAYAQGWQPPLIIAALFGATSFRRGSHLPVYRGNSVVVEPPASQRFVLRDLLRFGNAYWFLLILCVLWYAVILAFRSTFSIKYISSMRTV